MREDFRREVTLALKKAAEISVRGMKSPGKGVPAAGQQGHRPGGVTARLQDGFGGGLAGQGGMSGGEEGGDAEKYSQASLQRAALVVGVLACSMVNVRLLLHEQ